MANKVAAPHGFQPLRHISGGCISMNEYPIDPTDTTKIYNGDPVVLTAGLAGLAGADAAAILGIFAGCMFVNSKGEQIFSPYWDGALGSTEVKALVYDDANVTFKVQSDQAVTAADVGTAVGNVAGTGMLDSIGRSTAKVGAVATNNIFTIRGILPLSDNVSDNDTNLELEVVVTGMSMNA